MNKHNNWPQLERSHVEAAIKYINDNGVPSKRESHPSDSQNAHRIVQDKEDYPVKYVYEVAAAFARTHKESISDSDIISRRNFTPWDADRVFRQLGFQLEQRGTNRRSRTEVFSDLKNKFEQWLRKHVKTPETPERYVTRVEALDGEAKPSEKKTKTDPWFGLMAWLTGKTSPNPIGAVFRVNGLKDFKNQYKDVLSLMSCKKSELQQWKKVYSCDRFEDIFRDLSKAKPHPDSGFTQAALNNYIKFLEDLEKLVDDGSGSADSSTKSPDPPIDQDNKPLSRNLIYFGAPGTGKSFMLKDNVERPGNHFIEKDEDGESRYERVTFYPTYSYAQFVGCYKPTMESEKAPILPPERLVKELKTALVSWPEWIKVETDVTRIKAFVMLLFGEKFYDSLEPLKEEDLERIRKDAGAKTDYDKAYLSAGMAATKVRRRTSGTSGETIVYKFVPGPFLRVLVKALKEPTHNHCLVIEEINRANAAAVFGDVFQLLDRGSDGVSEYEVAASEDVKRFLQEKFKDCSPSKDDDPEESKKRNPLNFLKVAFKKDAKGNDTKEWDSCRLRIPSNMYIWATMNSADQGVFPMDTAFKRRWEFEYIDIDNGSPDCERWSIDGKYGYKWDAVRRLLNGLLSLHRVNEDKLMGAHFVKPEKGTDTVSEKSFKSKVLMYLWEDAARMCRRQMFGDIGTYSALLEAWDKNGVGIFSNDPELGKLKDADDTKKIFDELLTVEPTQPKSDEQTKSDDESASEPAP